MIYEWNGVRKVSEREEEFITIELEVKGHSTIAEGFKELIDGSRLEGENQYQLDSGEKVDAQKRICLGELPQTLIIQLKRFQLDYETMQNIKINSRCEFPTVLDLEPYTKAGLEARAAGRPGCPPEPYELVGVLVHTGTSNFGHYFSYIKAREGACQWHTFNDTTVSAFDEAQIGEMCYGGERTLPSGQTSEKVQNGFLLFYRRAPVTQGTARKTHRRSGSAPPAGFARGAARDSASRPTTALGADDLIGGTPTSAVSISRGSPRDDELPPPFTSSPQPSPLVQPMLGAGSLAADAPALALPVPLMVPLTPPPKQPLGTQRAISISPDGAHDGALGEDPGGSSLLPAVLARATAPSTIIGDLSADPGTAASTSGGAPPMPANEAERQAVLASVHAANAKLLLRQHLYDPMYIKFLLSLAQAAQKGPLRAIDATSPEGYPTERRAERRAGSAAATSAAMSIDGVSPDDVALWRTLPAPPPSRPSPLLSRFLPPLEGTADKSCSDGANAEPGAEPGASRTAVGGRIVPADAPKIPRPTPVGTADACVARSGDGWSPSWAPGGGPSSLQVRLLQLCGRFFFDHLIRLCPALLEPHITSGTGWLSALESACDRSLEGAVWLLHALLAPYPSSATATATATAGAAIAATAATPAAAPPAVAEASAASASSSAAATGTATALAAAPGTLSPRPISEAEEQAKALASGGGSGGGCWLLSALFDCQSAPARTVIVTFISRLVQRVGAVEVAAANQPASATEGNAHCGVPAGGVPLTTALTQPRFHTTRFVRGLLEVGLPHAAVHWGDAAPFCELIRTLVLLPGPVGVQLAPAWRMHGGLAALAAYIIGEGAIEMPEQLGEPIMGFPRPQRGASPPRSTSQLANNEGGAAILEAIAVLLESAVVPPSAGGADGAGATGAAEAAEAAKGTEAAEAAPGTEGGAEGEGLWGKEGEGLGAPTERALEPSPSGGAMSEASPTYESADGAASVLDARESGAKGVVAAAAVALALPAEPAHRGVNIHTSLPAEPAGLTPGSSSSMAGVNIHSSSSSMATSMGMAASSSAAMAAKIHTSMVASPSPPAVSAAPDLIASAAFVNSAVRICLRVGGEGLEPMHRALELCCHGAAERAATVLQANLAALRSESEAVAHAHAQVLVRLLTKVDDELIATRCAMALRIPHGLLALIKELVQSNPPAEAASRAEVEAEAEAANGGSPPRMRPFSEAARTFLCLRVLLELHASGGTVATWLEETLAVSDVAEFLNWLKETSRTAALGKPSSARGFLGVPRISTRPRYERSDEQQAALDQLKALEKALEKARAARLKKTPR